MESRTNVHYFTFTVSVLVRNTAYEILNANNRSASLAVAAGVNHDRWKVPYRFTATVTYQWKKVKGSSPLKGIRKSILAARLMG